MSKYTIVLSFLSFVGYAQQVVATSGDSYSTPSASLSWTLGELSTETVRASNIGTATQGMQQATLSIVTEISTTDLQVTASVYPNPTSSSVQITFQEQSLESLVYSLCDINGTELSRGTIGNATSVVDLSALSNAAYLLKIIKGDKEQKSFKIIKQ